RTLAQAMVPASIFMLSLIIYTGFTIPVRDMHPWFRWISYLNPIAYAFEALMINEFHDRRVPCSTYVPMGPSYLNATGASIICGSTGAKTGETFVDGDAFINTLYEYYASHLWRNFGIILGFFFFFLFTYLAATELVSAKPSKGEILVFPRGKIPAFVEKSLGEDENDPELGAATNEKRKIEQGGHGLTAAIVKQTSI